MLFLCKWDMDHDKIRLKKVDLFERKILRKIFGSKRNNDGVYTMRNNEELNKH